MAEELPEVLVVGPPTCFPTLEPLYSHKFRFLNHKASGLPLRQFLVSHSSTRAILCSTTYPLPAPSPPAPPPPSPPTFSASCRHSASSSPPAAELITSTSTSAAAGEF